MNGRSVFIGDKSVLCPVDAVAAIILSESGQVLMQLRDPVEGIFYPGHWGCFGGAIDADDSSVLSSLQREILEELGLSIKDKDITYFTEFTFDMAFAGIENLKRTYFEIVLGGVNEDDIVLGEGSDFRFFDAEAILAEGDVVPYDSYALWMYFSRSRIKPAESID